MTTSGHTDQQPTLVEVQAAVRAFLQEAMPDVHRVDVTRIGRADVGDAAWEAEAIVWQPNTMLQALGLATRHPVLDQNAYLIRLDNRLNVTGYEAGEAERAS